MIFVIAFEEKDLELAERGLLCPSIAGPTISLLSFDMR